MRYLINRKTKEHKAFDEKGTIPEPYADWVLIQADSEGWIPHTGKECPLPDDVWCEMQFSTGGTSSRLMTAKEWDWASKYITHYRPFLAGKVQEPMSTTDWNKAVRDSTDKLLAEAGYQPDSSVRHGLAMMNFDKPTPSPQYDPPSVSSLFEQLAAAHEAAAKIPDIIAAIKAKLELYGHTVVPLSPFVAAEFVEPEAIAEQDMNDWRNWREGDLVQYTGQPHAGFSLYCLYGICELLSALCIYDDDGDDRPLESNAYRFRFHSRPAQQRHGAGE